MDDLCGEPSMNTRTMKIDDLTITLRIHQILTAPALETTYLQTAEELHASGYIRISRRDKRYAYELTRKGQSIASKLSGKIMEI
jgi:predicted transcriptional regulator